MKRLLNLFVSVAAAAMAFASCEMVVENSVPQDEYVYTFTLGSADETKATIGENSVVWEEGDQMGVYTISTSGTSYNRYGDITPGTPATMEISSYYALSAGDMVYAYYPYTSNNSTVATTVSMSIPTSQDGKDDMPMVSLPIAMASDLAERTDVNLPAGELKFVNLGAVIEFNVYTDTDAYADEVVKAVSFESDKAIAGNFTYDITTVDYSDKTTLQIPALTDNKVVAPVNNVTVGTRENPIVVNMVVAPGSYSGNVVVTTDKATYTYSITEAKEFVRSAIKPFGLNLRENVRTEIPAAVEDLVVANGSLTSGGADVLLEAGKAIMYSDIKGGSNYAEHTPGRFYKDNVFTVKSYAGNIKEISIECTGSEYATNLNNSVSSLGSITTSDNTVTLSLTNPSTTVTWTNSGQWRANTMSVTYVSNGEIAVMPRNLSFSAATANATVGQDFDELTLTGNKIDDVTYSSSDQSVATVDVSTGEVTILAAGTTTISASASATAEFEAGEASYTLTVEEAPQGGEIVLLSEDFSSLKSWSTTSVNSLTVGNLTWTSLGATMYAQVGCIKFGKSSAAAGLGVKLPKMTSIESPTKVKLTFKAVSSAGDYKLSVTANNASVGTLTPANITKYSTSINNGASTATALTDAFNSSAEFSVEISNVTAETEISIGTSVSAKQWFLDDVNIVVVE